MLNRGYWVLQRDAISQRMWYGVIRGIINYEQTLADVQGRGNMARDISSTKKSVIYRVYKDERNNYNINMNDI